MYRHQSSRPLRSAVITALLLLVTSTGRAGESGVDARPPQRWWLGLDVGFVAVAAKPEQSTGSRGLQASAGIEGGVVITPNWRFGLQFDTTSLGDARCHTASLGSVLPSSCRPRKHSVDHEYLTLLAQPGGGPWLYQASAGRTAYTLEEMPLGFNDYYVVEDKGGWGVRFATGRDWHRDGSRTHIGWRASVEYADPGRLSGGLGSTAHLTTGLSLSVSWY